MIQRLLFISFIAGLFGGCSFSDGGIAVYREEANSYCEAHNPEYWIKSGRLDELNAMNPTDKALALIKEFRSKVSSKEMTEIIFEKGGELPATEFYPFLQKNIPKLTKQPFECPAIPEFYIAR